MPHADTDTGADVTARALALATECAMPGAKATGAELRALAAIAAAAVRLASDPEWWLTFDAFEEPACIGCRSYTEGSDHASDCRAMQLDAAIRAAGELAP